MRGCNGDMLWFIILIFLLCGYCGGNNNCGCGCGNDNNCGC